MFLILGETTLCVCLLKVWMNLSAERCIVIWSVNGSREHSWFSFYLIKMWWCLKSCRGDRLVEWQGIKTPITWLVSVEDPVWCSRICLAFTMACICQGAERDAPFPHVSRRFYLSICLFCHNCTLLAPEVEHHTGTTKSTMLIFERRWKWYKSIEPVLRYPQFSKFRVRFFTTSIMVLMGFFFFFYWAILMHCHLQCFTDSLGASLLK